MIMIEYLMNYDNQIPSLVYQRLGDQILDAKFIIEPSRIFYDQELKKYEFKLGFFVSQ